MFKKSVDSVVIMLYNIKKYIKGVFYMDKKNYYKDTAKNKKQTKNDDKLAKERFVATGDGLKVTVTPKNKAKQK